MCNWLGFFKGVGGALSISALLAVAGVFIGIVRAQGSQDGVDIGTSLGILLAAGIALVWGMILTEGA